MARLCHFYVVVNSGERRRHYSTSPQASAAVYRRKGNYPSIHWHDKDGTTERKREIQNGQQYRERDRERERTTKRKRKRKSKREAGKERERGRNRGRRRRLRTKKEEENEKISGQSVRLLVISCQLSFGGEVIADPAVAEDTGSVVSMMTRRLDNDVSIMTCR